MSVSFLRQEPAMRQAAHELPQIAPVKDTKKIAPRRTAPEIGGRAPSSLRTFTRAGQELLWVHDPATKRRVWEPCHSLRHQRATKIGERAGLGFHSRGDSP